MDPRPIGVFDSGVGGLTVLAALEGRLPAEHLVYLGDTARVPYGTRSPDTVRRYARAVASHLVQWAGPPGLKALVVACNTATAHALDDLAEAGARIGLPVFGVVEPGVALAAATTRNGHVAVLATEATVAGGRYQERLAARGLRGTAVACGLLVALAEEGWHEGAVAEAAVTRYVGHLDHPEGPDTVILGCTHFPLLAGVIGRALPRARLVDSATSTAEVVAQALQASGLLVDSPSPGPRQYLVTDNLDRFRRVGAHFLGVEPSPARVVDLGPPGPPFLVDGA